MTIKLKVGLPKAQISTVSLPSELKAGEDIIGYVQLKNIGEGKGRLRLYITTLWDGAMYYWDGVELDVGATYSFTFTTGWLKMPSQDASIKLEGQSWDGAKWVTDETKTH